MEQEREILVNLGPQHPSTHGVLRVIAKLDGETVTWCQPDVGYLHRCFEKLAEKRTFPQVVPYTDRTDYLSAITNETCYVEAVEKLFNGAIEVPERAQYIRVMMNEMQRICSHLLALGSMAMDIGAMTPFLYCFRDREKIYSLFERITGGRQLYNYLRIGGVRNDLPEGILGTPGDGEDKADQTLWGFINYFDSYVIPQWRDLVTENRIFQWRTQGVGCLPADVAVAYSASGAVLRGSGVKWDLRKNKPYLIYDRLDFDIPVGTSGRGDCYDRWCVRAEEMVQSSRIVKQCLEWLAENPGPVMAPKVPRVIKPPKGEVYHRIEGSRGEVACYIVSDGGTSPYKVKWRSPCFTHLQLMPYLCPGHKVADLIAILGSIDIVLGEVDR